MQLPHQNYLVEEAARRLNYQVSLGPLKLACHLTPLCTEQDLRGTPVFWTKTEDTSRDTWDRHQFELVMAGPLEMLWEDDGADGLAEYLQMGERALPWRYRRHMLEDESFDVPRAAQSPFRDCTVQVHNTAFPPMPTRKPPMPPELK